MRTSVLLAALGLMLGAAGAAAQVYKCGKEFSDKPCGDNAVKPGSGSSGNAGSAAGRSSDTMPEYATICLDAIRAKVNFPDKEALRIDGHSKKWENFEYADKPMAGQKVTLLINALLYGSYSGARPYSCYMSEDARRVLKIGGA